MAIRQSVIWTALPNGVKGAEARLSVFVSPRLEWDGAPEDAKLTLINFPDFIDWPSLVAKATFEVFIDGMSVLGPVAANDGHLRSDLWKALFKEGCPVRPFAFADRSTSEIVSYPVAGVLEDILQLYVALGRDYPHSMPSRDQVEKVNVVAQWLSLLKDKKVGPDNKRMYDVWLSNPFDVETLRGLAGSGHLANLAQLLLFHRRPATDVPLPPLRAPEPDFHQIVSALGQYPQLLRVLGLVVDLRIPTPSNAAASGNVKVVVNWAHESPTKSVSPATRWRTPLFLPEPLQESDLEDGLVRVGTGNYQVFQVDIDGAAIKLTDFLGNLLRYQSSPMGPDPNPGLPALRSSGIAVARSNRAVPLERALKRAKSLNEMLETQPETVELYADDLVRGYRIWIRAGQSEWLSLCRRSETHQFLDAPKGALASYETDAWISSAGTEPDTSQPQLYVHEALFHWEGWALCAPRPMAAMTPPHLQAVKPKKEDGAGAEGKAEEKKEVPVRTPTEPPREFRLQASLSAVGRSLPRLRFGTTYKIAISPVDLAGNALESSDEAGGFSAHAPKPERLGEPSFTLETRYLRYEPVAPPRVVLSQLPSDDRPGEAPERLVIRSYNDDSSKDEVPTAETSERHLVAPRIDQLTAEAHGVFDGMSPSDSYELILKRQGDFSPGAQMTHGEPAVLPDLKEDATVVLPYLPDPAATGVTLSGVPGLKEGEVAKVSGDDPMATVPDQIANAALLMVDATGKNGKWQNPRSLRLRLADGDARPAWEPAARVLTVSLAKGTIWTTRYSSSIAKHRHLFALCELVSKSAGAEELHTFDLAVKQGVHWALSPYREMTLVHAVLQPLRRPRLSNLSASRNERSTFADLGGQIDFDGPSTGEVAILAEWDDWIDEGKDPKQPQKRTAHVATLKVEYPKSGGRIIELDLNNSAVRHELGDTRFRSVRYTAIGTSRFAEYFRSEQKQLTRESKSVEVDLLATARPQPPIVQYVMPTFSWSIESNDGEITRIRRGNSLRVYLERGWYSSGAGELLAVVVSAAAGPVSKEEEDWVTQFGRDPVWETWPVALGRKEYFSRAKQLVSDVHHPDIGKNVHLAVHSVEFDGTRWYADLTIRELDHDYYMPFVRLALGRFQANALGGSADLRLSSVLVTDPVQLLPDRRLLITPADNGTRKVTLHGQAPRGKRFVEGRLQRRRPDIKDDVLGWEEPEDWKEHVASAPVQEPQWPPVSDPGPLLWEGNVTIPQVDVPVRMVVREFEEYATAPEPSVGDQAAVGRRLVYVDAVTIA